MKRTNGHKHEQPDRPKPKPLGMIAKKDLDALIEQALLHQGRIDKAAGNLGDLIREYAAKKNLHRAAFAAIKTLRRMGGKDPGKLWLYLAHFDDMRDKLGLDKLAQQQGQLLDDGTAEPEARLADPPTRQPRTGEQVRVVAETAGAKLG